MLAFYPEPRADLIVAAERNATTNDGFGVRGVGDDPHVILYMYWSLLDSDLRLGRLTAETQRTGSRSMLDVVKSACGRTPSQTAFAQLAVYG